MTTTDVRDMTAAQVGLDTERQIQIALQEIVDRGGEAKSDQLYEAIERNMPADIVLSQQGRDTFCELLNRLSVRASDINVATRDAQHGWFSGGVMMSRIGQCRAQGERGSCYAA